MPDNYVCSIKLALPIPAFARPSPFPIPGTFEGNRVDRVYFPQRKPQPSPHWQVGIGGGKAAQAPGLPPWALHAWNNPQGGVHRECAPFGPCPLCCVTQEESQ